MANKKQAKTAEPKVEESLTFNNPTQVQQVQEQMEQEEIQEAEMQAQQQAQQQQANQDQQNIAEINRLQIQINDALLNGKYNWDVEIAGLLRILQRLIINAARHQDENGKASMKRYIENFMRNDIYFQAGMHYF